MKNLLFAVAGLFMFSVAAVAQPFGQSVGPGSIPCAYTTCTVQNIAVLSTTLPTNGMYLSGANTLSWATNSTLALTLSSVGTLTAVGNVLGVNAIFSGDFRAVSNGSRLILRASVATIMSSPADASWQLGDADVDTTAAMVAQTLRSQGALAGGTSNQAGVNWTFIASPGKGTGAGGSFLFQTAPAGSTGTAVNASVKRLGIDSAGAITMPSLASSSAAQTGTVCWTTATGNLTVDTTTTCLLSLEEYKNIKGDIAPAKALGEVLKLKPIWFSYKPGHASTDFRVHAGLGAHQVEDVDPRLAGYDAKGKLTGVRYADSITSLNVAAIQELSAEIVALKAKVTRLEHRR